MNSEALTSIDHPIWFVFLKIQLKPQLEPHLLHKMYVQYSDKSLKGSNRFLGCGFGKSLIPRLRDPFLGRGSSRNLGILLNPVHQVDPTSTVADTSAAHCPYPLIQVLLRSLLQLVLQLW